MAQTIQKRGFNLKMENYKNLEANDGNSRVSEIKNPEVTKEIDEGVVLPGNFEQENVQKESGAVMNIFEDIPVKILLDRFLHPAAKMKDPELSVMSVGTDLFYYPLYTEEFCKILIDHANRIGKWTSKRHEFYPTTDMLLETLGLGNFHREVLVNYTMPIVKHVWRYEYPNDSIEDETFLVKYSPDGQPGLGTHNDAALFANVVRLNDDYDGGGTHFSRQNLMVDAPTGYATLHPGRLTHPHSGMPLTRGERYILVSFCEHNKYRR